jgi:hypothetical protein
MYCHVRGVEAQVHASLLRNNKASLFWMVLDTAEDHGWMRAWELSRMTVAITCSC